MNQIKMEDFFISEDWLVLFLEAGFDFLYLTEMDTLFACEIIVFPNDINPFFTVKGFNCNDFRNNTDVTIQLKNKFQKIISEPFPELKFSQNYKWFYYKDNLTSSRQRLLKRLKGI